MSASRNPDAVSTQGEFKSRVAPAEPMTTQGHQPGRKVTQADHAPEFSAQTLPAGSAPPDRTFQPDTTSKVPGQAQNPDVNEEAQTTAESTLGGATSSDLYTGYGRPAQGQTSTELRHDGQHTRKGQPGVSAGATDLNAANPRIDERQRALEKEEGVRGRGDKGDLGAEDLPPTTAGELADEIERET